MVDALVLRCAENLLAIDQANQAEMAGTVFAIQRAIDGVTAFVDQNPAAVALCLTAGESGAGRVLYDGLKTSIAQRLLLRVPNITMPEVEVVASTVVGIILGMLNAYLGEEWRRPIIRQELVYVLSAYLYSRFPPPNDPVWTGQGQPVQPARPSTPGAFAHAIAWPALAPDQH